MDLFSFIIADIFPNIIGLTIFYLVLLLFQNGYVISPIILLLIGLFDRFFSFAKQIGLNQNNSIWKQFLLAAFFLCFLDVNYQDINYYFRSLEGHFYLIYYPFLIILIDLSNDHALLQKIPQINYFKITLFLNLFVTMIFLYFSKFQNRFVKQILANNVSRLNQAQKVFLFAMMTFRCSFQTNITFVTIAIIWIIIEIMFFKIFTMIFIKISNQRILQWATSSVFGDNYFSEVIQDNISNKTIYKNQISSLATVIIKIAYIFILIFLSTYFEDKRLYQWTALLQLEILIPHLRFYNSSKQIKYFNQIFSKKEILPFLMKHQKEDIDIYVDYKKSKQNSNLEYQQMEDQSDLNLNEQIILLKLLNKQKDYKSITMKQFGINVSINQFIVNQIVSREGLYEFLYEVDYIPAIFAPPSSYMGLDFNRICINRSLLLLKKTSNCQNYLPSKQMQKEIKQLSFQILAFQKQIKHIFEVNPTYVLYNLYGDEDF